MPRNDEPVISSNVQIIEVYVVTFNKIILNCLVLSIIISTITKKRGHG